MRREQVERWYEQYGAALVAYGCALVADRASAEDMVQQIFLKLLRHGTLDAENPRAYLYRAVRNAAFNVRRTTAREVALDSEQPWFAARASSFGSGSPRSELEDALALQSALLAIPPEQREVVVMRIWGEMTFEEIAEVLSLPANTAASRYRYGLTKLREQMKVREVDKNGTRK